jgi:hypothetical protein
MVEELDFFINGPALIHMVILYKNGDKEFVKGALWMLEVMKLINTQHRIEIIERLEKLNAD